MTTIELKKYIYENNKIEYVLDNIGCQFIKYHSGKEFYSCANYNGDNKNAVNVYNNEYIRVKNWTRQNEFDEKSDLISLVEYNKNLSFPNAVKYLHKILNLKYTFKQPKKKTKEIKDPLQIFKRITLGYNKLINVEDIDVLDEEILDDYSSLLHISWLREGILPHVADEFGLAYSYRHKRIIIPIRYWVNGDLLAVNKRTTIENFDELGIEKYMITSGYQKSNNLYGLYENYKHIQKKDFVCVFESEKSVLIRASRQLKKNNEWDKTGVALQGKVISDEQVRILIGLNVEIVICLDNDVAIEDIWNICEKFYGIRKVSYIKDKWGLLGDKDSPADARNDIYDFLLRHREIYDIEKHNEYLKRLEK